MVLIASSPFFLSLLKRNKHTHPLVYMRGVKFEDLDAMVDFLYLGEANVFQEHLESFLALTEELQLKEQQGERPPSVPFQENFTAKQDWLQGNQAKTRKPKMCPGKCWQQ